MLGGFQILAHFAKAPRASFSPALGRRNAESAMKQVSEVTVTGETEVQSQRAEIRFACADPFESSPQAKPVTVLVKRQAGFPAEKAREMEGGGIHGAGNFPQGQVFGKARSQQQAGPFCLLAMSPGGGGTAWLGPEAAWVINAPNDRRQEVHSQLVEGQSVVALGQCTLAQSMLGKENSLITQRMSELKRLLRPILNVRLVAGYRFAQQVRGEGEHRAIIAVAHRVGHAVRLVPSEEKNLIGIGDDLLSADAFQEHPGARKHDVVGVGKLFGATLAGEGPAADVADRYAATAMKHARLQSRGHKQQITNSRTLATLHLRPKEATAWQ